MTRDLAKAGTNAGRWFCDASSDFRRLTSALSHRPSTFCRSACGRMGQLGLPSWFYWHLPTDGSTQILFFRRPRGISYGGIVMNTKKYFWCVLLFVSLSQVPHALGASHIACDQVHAAARIARAKSLRVVAEERAKPIGSYVVDLVSAFRTAELQPRSRVAAAGLLAKIPSDEAQHAVILALDSALCEGELDAELDVLARVKYALPRELARAVELAPEYIDAYVRYSLHAAPSPHTDYAIQMQKVCRDLHVKFVKAVDALPESDREWFGRGVFDPKRCRAIARPEAR